MSVYLDTKGHLTADSRDEAHAFADRLGLRREWFQDRPVLWHYDVMSWRKQAQAVRWGAVVIEPRETVRRLRALPRAMEGSAVPFDISRLMDLSRAKSATAVRLRCASSSDSNEFWQAIGFECIAVQPGGIKRARDINVWRAELQPGMFALPSTDPSTRAIDLRAYTRLVKAGTAMPSRFSRVHYGSDS